MNNDVSNAVRRVLLEEANAISAQLHLAEVCAQAIDVIIAKNDPLIISGVGKSGHIASKIASTFCSLGKPAIFVHATEAGHGDLGLIQKNAAVIMLSNSGETTELSHLIRYCKHFGNPIIAITGNRESTLAKAADYVIAYDVEKEACRNGLAPTTSTTVALAIGDALAIGFSEATQITIDDFKYFHPGGQLADNLRTAEQVMVPIHKAPLIDKNATMSDVLIKMTEGQLGIGILMEGAQVFGVISDGDLRRHAQHLMERKPIEIASKSPISVQKTMRVDNIRKFMNQKGISQVLVYDGETLIGIAHIHKLSGSSV